MVSQRDPAQARFQLVVAAGLVVSGVLDAVAGFLPGGSALIGWLGVALAVVAAVWLVATIRRYRHERGRAD